MRISNRFCNFFFAFFFVFRSYPGVPDDFDNTGPGVIQSPEINFPLQIGVTPMGKVFRSEEHTSELQSLMRISYAVFCLKKKNTYTKNNIHYYTIVHAT